MVERWPSSEQDVAEPMVKYLRDMGWEVYQEVPCPGGRVDIVAKRNGLYHALEVKRSYGLRVLDQAISTSPRFHYTSVVVPRRRSNSRPGTGRAAKIVHRETGLGLWVSRPQSQGLPYEGLAPRLTRVPDHLASQVEDRLYEAQKHYETAGSSSGTYWSPWRENCRRVSEYVHEHPGCSTEELLGALDDHHYARDATFRHQVPRDARNGKIEGVRFEGGRFYPRDPAARDHEEGEDG